jgi:hypothetical protein
MGLFDRVEAKLERGINGIFAKAFRSEVQPVEIASAVRRAMDDRAAIAGKGRTLVPNVFLIELSPTDFERLHEYEEDIADEIVAAAQEHADSQRYDSAGRIRVDLVEADDLETGVFRVRPSKAKRTGATGTHGALRDEPAGRSPAPPSAPTRAPEQPRPPRRRSDDDSWQEQLTGDHEIPRSALPVGGEQDDDGLEPTAAHVPVTAARRRVNPADRPWLDVDGDRYPLMGALTILGRDDSADILLDDPGISRRHSEIRVTTDGPHHVCSIRDLDSTNGTFLNGERITSARLEDGDRVTVGRTSVTFRAGRRG